MRKGCTCRCHAPSWGACASECCPECDPFAYELCLRCDLERYAHVDEAREVHPGACWDFKVERDDVRAPGWDLDRDDDE